MSSKPPRGPDTPDPSETTDGDRTLYPHEVASSAYEKSSLDEPATSLVPFELPTEERYEERGVIAYGGMGVIERLYDRRLGRTVVRKTAHPSPPTLETRLAKEAWVISQLDHPGIIQVLDAGSLRTGGGYYTMPLVHGRSLRDVLAEPLATDERRRLLRQIRDACEAVGYAHQEGFVHRDLKPDNIMVGDFGDTRVMDWGLARPASGAAGDRWREHFPKQQVALTKVGAVLGTPAYMSPEQARGEPLGATADVWSLGAIIYEILSGEPLFPGTDARAVLTGVAQGADRSLERLGDEIPGPLKAILRRSLHQEPGGRFTDAKELSDELTRFLEGRAVESHRYTSAEQIGNLVVRWKIPIIAATASFSIGLVGMAFLAVQTWQESELAREAQQTAENAQRASEFGRRKGEQHLKQALVAQVRSAIDRNDRVTGEVLAAASLRISADPVSMGALLKWHGQPPPKRLSTTALPPDIERAALSPDGRWLAGLGPGYASLWRAHPLEMQWSRRVDEVQHMGVTDTGRLIIRESRRTLIFEQDGTAAEHPPPLMAFVVSDPRSGDLFDYNPVLNRMRTSATENREAVRLTDCAQALAFTKDGWWTACPEGLVRSRAGTLDEGALPIQFDQDAVLQLSAAQDALYLGSIHSRVARLDAETREVVWLRAFDQADVRSIVRSDSTGHLIISFGRGNPILLDQATGRTLLSLPPGRPVQAIAADDGGVLTVLSDEDLVRYQLDSRLRPTTWSTPSGVTDLEFSSDGATLAVATGLDVQLRRWPDGSVIEEANFTKVVKDMDYDHSGSLIIATSLPSDGFESAVLQREDDGTWSPYGHPEAASARRFATLGNSGVIVAAYGSTGPMFAAATVEGERWTVGDVLGGASAIENTRDASTVVWTARSGLWVMREGEGAPKLIEGIPKAWAIGVDDAGTIAVVGTPERTLMVRLSSGEIVWEKPAEGVGPVDIALDPSARLTALGLRDGRIAIHDVATGRIRALIPAHHEKVGGVVFTPDGETLVTGGWDDEIRLWDLTPLQGPLEPQLRAIEELWGLDPTEVLRELQ